MTPLYGARRRVATRVQRLLGFSRGFSKYEAIGVVDRDGQLVGGAVYHNWNPESGTIEVTAASSAPNWATREVVRAVFGYPFDIGCQLLVARTAEGNDGPLRVWRALGADFYRIPRLRGPDQAEIITTLTVERWKETRWARVPLPSRLIR